MDGMLSGEDESKQEQKLKVLHSRSGVDVATLIHIMSERVYDRRSGKSTCKSI